MKDAQITKRRAERLGLNLAAIAASAARKAVYFNDREHPDVWAEHEYLVQLAALCRG